MTSWKDRVKVLLKKRKMTQTQLAEKLGVTKPTVSIWLGDNVSFTDKNVLKMQYEIATVLNVDPQYIISGKGAVEPTVSIGRALPHLSDADIADWVVNRIAPDNLVWRNCPVDCSEQAFCLTVTGSSMDNHGMPCTSYPNGSLVFIDPKLPAEAGKVCLFQDQGPVLGTYEELNCQSMLVFNNPRFQSLSVLRDNYIGQAIGCFCLP